MRELLALASLEAPYLPGESPRGRTDLMLEALAEERLCELRGRDGRRVGLAVLETLLRSGCPCTLEYWEAGGPRTVTLGNVTFPVSQKAGHELGHCLGA